MFKNIHADLKTYGGDWATQGFWAMMVYRLGRWRYTITSAWLHKPSSRLYKFLYKCIQIITGIELSCEVVVAKGIVIDHFRGIVISGFARLGDNCRIRNSVVVGLKNVSDPCALQIGHNVVLGEHCILCSQVGIAVHELRTDVGGLPIRRRGDDEPDERLAAPAQSELRTEG